MASARKPVEKQADRAEFLLRLNNYYMDLIKTSYKEWGYNSIQDFFVQATKDLLDKHLNQIVKPQDEDFMDIYSDISKIESHYKDLNYRLNEIKDSNEQSIKYIGLLLSYVAMSSAGFLAFNNKDHLIRGIKEAIKTKKENINEISLNILLEEIMDRPYDGFKNSGTH